MHRTPVLAYRRKGRSSLDFCGIENVSNPNRQLPFDALTSKISTEAALRSNHALLLIDLQVDFLAPDGRLPILQSQVPGLLDACRTSFEHAAAMNWPIVAIGNEFSPWDPLNIARRFATIRGSSGARWDPRAPLGRDIYLAKHFPSAFTNPHLDSWLRERGIGHVHLAGVQAKACVKATARSALRRDYRVYIIDQAIGDTSDEARLAALASLRKMGCGVSSLAVSVIAN